MTGQTFRRPKGRHLGFAFAAGSLFGLCLLLAGWSAPLDALPDGQFGVIVGLAVVGLLAFTLLLWLVVVLFILG